MIRKFDRREIIKILGLFVVGIACKGNSRLSKEKDMISGSNFSPSYLKLLKNDQLKLRGKELWKSLKHCNLCPRMCLVNRLNGEKGICGADSQLTVSSYNPHFGEERPLVGSNGSGTIFFTHCSLKCVFCINWEISHRGMGNIINIEDLAKMMLRLQKLGCHNINLVTPTHYLPHIILALDIAAKEGLKLPIVYNTHGYENIEIIKMLEGIVDIYMPDFKYYDNEMSAKFSAGASDYCDITKQAILEMHRQVGVAHPANDGILYKGLLIRHLVMPNNVGGSKAVIRWIAENLPHDTYVNIMSQYHPYFRAKEFTEINRRITKDEYFEVVNFAIEKNLTNIDIQGY